jgi:TolA-binding protein
MRQQVFPMPGVTISLAAALGAMVLCVSAAPLTQDEAAAALLNSANRAFNERKYDFAVDRFREFLKQFGSHRDVARAEYGVGLALLEGPRRDYEGAAQALQSSVGRGEFPDRAFALYYLGLARRGLAEKAEKEAADAAAAKPVEAEARRNAASQRFSEAAGSFTEAANLFKARAGSASGAEAATNLEWTVRARCDLADLLLRLGRNKETADAAEACLKEAAAGNSPYRELALYQQGYARFGLKDYPAAGRLLSQLAPFEQPFGTHTRYLLGRIHHLAEERPEAALQYRAALADHEQRKKAAQTAMQNPGALTPERRAACEALLRGPAPEYLGRATFYLALIACESERYGEALEGFAAFIQQNPASPYVAEAQLRQGFCRLQMGNYAEAVAALQALTNQPPRADRALWWLARCQFRTADPKNTNTFETAVRTVTDNLRRAADLAGRLAQSDADARIRRGDILMDLADTLVAVKRYKDAAGTYQRVLQENPSPTRAEEATQRRMAALHLAGSYRESDELGAQFEQAYPNSVLLPAVIFRRAENAYLTATAMATNPAALPNRTQDVPRQFRAAITAYQRIIERYPDSSYLNLARDGIGSCYYRLGRYKDAADALSAVPPDAYSAELAHVPYVLADCLIRCAPQDPTDAIAAAELLDKARQAAKLLDRFAAANDKSPQLPDALLKQGWCCSRIAEMTQNADERKQAWTSGRAAYDRLVQQFPQSPSVPVALYERANCQAALGDAAGAVSELNRFVQVPALRASAAAPLAVVRMAALMRGQNRAQDAVNALQQYRLQCESNLVGAAAQSNVLAFVQYEQAMSLRQAGKTAEARVLFETVFKRFPGHPVAANAAWRATQSRREELSAQMDAARQTLARSGGKPDALATARRNLTEALNGIRDAVFALQAWADTFGKSAPGSDAHLNALYEIAWACRALADVEIETTVRQLRQDATARLRLKLAAQLPAGQVPETIREPVIEAADVPMPQSERTALDTYERMIAAAPDAPLAGQARLELADLYTRRREHDAAARVLAAALSQRPAPQLVPQIRVRLAAAWLGYGKPDIALVQAEPVVSEGDSLLAGYARYLMGEAYFRQEDWKRAIERLQPFRDHGPLQNLPDVSDRALLRLGQAYLKTGQPDPCRQALAALRQRFPGSDWVDEALYTIGLALQQQGKHDEAAEIYRQVTGRTASAWGAQAQLQIGRCRMAQTRHADAVQAFLAVPLTYDYPEWHAPAYVEAARACQELKNTEEAVRYLQKVTQQYADTPWAQIARDQLNTLEQGN